HNRGAKVPTPACPVSAAHLENVREIGSKMEGKVDFHVSQAKVLEPDALVASSPPQEFAPEDVQSVPWDSQPVPVEQVGVGQVYRQVVVVLLDRRAEEEGSVLIQEEKKAGQ